ncbi:NPP1 family protein [Streptomyces sp. NPDC020858]|uniref:NPP1 family protein n=1 Tax=Streptomyces sp. NPDC020858 TaxID=3365097 RepID=UPI0037BB36D0
MYASYFEKDQVGTCAPNACAGHTHDFEHVIVWVQNNQVKYVSVSCHAGWSTFGRSSIRFDPSGTHPKIVYHQDGGSTHCFRIANSGDEAVEHVTGGWVYPRLVGWEGYNDVDHRNHFIYSQSTKNHFGSASIKLGTGTIENQLASADRRPAGRLRPAGRRRGQVWASAGGGCWASRSPPASVGWRSRSASTAPRLALASGQPQERAPAGVINYLCFPW